MRQASFEPSAVRSWLFVPGDSERKQAKAVGSAADALILDLEDSVGGAQLPGARSRVRELLSTRQLRSTQQLWVRVNALSSGLLLADLVAVCASSPDGIVIPKVAAAADIVMIDHYLAALEAREEKPPGAIRLMVIGTESPQGLLALGSYPQALSGYPQALARVAGLTWGAEDLSAAMGITNKTDSDGALSFTLQLARSHCALTAHALGVQAIDGVFLDFRDSGGLRRELQQARQDGFTAKLAIHPDQVGPINEAFMPSAAELEWARRVVAAFDKGPDTGVTSLNGKMIDRPHLLLARRILSLGDRESG